MIPCDLAYVGGPGALWLGNSDMHRHWEAFSGSGVNLRTLDCTKELVLFVRELTSYRSKERQVGNMQQEHRKRKLALLMRL